MEKHTHSIQNIECDGSVTFESGVEPVDIDITDFENVLACDGNSSVYIVTPSRQNFFVVKAAM